MDRTLVALLTDFGQRDPYVAVMKGVIAARCRAEIIDLSHEIEPFDRSAAAHFLRSVAPWWRAGREEEDPRVIFLTVVDPGVGSDRRILAAAQDGQLFVAPDNGVLSRVLEEEAVVVSVESEELFLPGGSTTFHGRDRFAPVAAALARGVPLGSLGRQVDRASLEGLEVDPPRYDQEPIRGTVVTIDRFGNVITDLEAERIPDLKRRELVVGDRVVGMFADHYAAAPSGQPVIVIGSGGTLEISMREASAADFLQIGRFETLVLRRL